MWDLLGVQAFKLDYVVATQNRKFVSFYDVIMVHHISGPPNYDVVMTD